MAEGLVGQFQKAVTMPSNQSNGNVLRTRIVPVQTSNLGAFKDRKTLDTWELPSNESNLEPLREAAKHLRQSSIPVGFPTETVYGLAADATRSDAVKGIYKAKGRPSDNPLIIHVCDLTMLRSYLVQAGQTNGKGESVDPIPAIYRPMIRMFWPGPLTMLMPNPQPSKLAPEVTAGLPTFGVRMPDSPLALSLIHLAGVPLAAPSANASTKPSPTTAEHVRHDLEGNIELILDGGHCQVGVESTVVDGMCDPPVVLRPGGLSIDRIRECPGWEGVVKGYKDQSEIGASAPRAPGMKYKHYSPKAKVVLYEAAPQRGTKDGIPLEAWEIVEAKLKKMDPFLGLEKLERPITVGIVSTKFWAPYAGFNLAKRSRERNEAVLNVRYSEELVTKNSFNMREGELYQGIIHPSSVQNPPSSEDEYIADLIEISLGSSTKDIAHGLFSALRELDERGVYVIFVEGIEDEGDIAAAVMNRLRKAATIIK